MKEITYDLIKPIIINQEAKGSLMLCQFGTNNTNEIINSSARIKKLDQVDGQSGQKGKSPILHLKKIVSGLMQGIFGGTTDNHKNADQTFTYKTKPSAFTKREKQTAVVEAFVNVISKFFYDESNQKWVLARSLSPFDKQCLEHPIEKQYDKEILARIMVELAKADENIAAEEKDFLESFISQEIGSIDEFMQMEPVSKVELEETTHSIKETMYMLAWTVALIDRELAIAEKVKLNEFKTMLSLSDEKAENMVKLAQYYIIENIIAFNTLTKDELYDLADKIELDREDAERCMIEFKKRIE